MAIVISGVNNNDKITASDGTIDLLSGVNYAGIITAPAFTTTGNLTAGSINVGSGIQVGNAGIITATTLVGNVTGNVNHTSNLLLQISGSEKLRIANSGAFGLNGTNYGSSGQVLTSQGSGSSPVWSTIASTTLKDSGNNTRVSATLTGAVVSGILTATASMNVKQSGNAYLNLLSTGTGNAGIYMDASNGDIAGSDYCSIYQKNDLDLAITNRKNTASIIFETGGENERLRIGSSGQIGIAGANYGTSGQVLTSQGSGSTVQWATPTSTNATASPSTGGGTVSGQRVASDLSYSSGSNGTTVVLGNVSNCSTSSIYALEISLTYMHNGSTNHGYLTSYIFQTGKTYGTDGAYYSEQHYDWYYNYVWSRALLPWDPSGTQSLSMHIQSAYNTSSANRFYVDIANKLQNI